MDDQRTEQWRAVAGYGGCYQVSDLGRVRSMPYVDAQGGRRRMRVHRPGRMDAWGHLGVTLRRDGVVTSRYVHQLVLEAFVGPRPAGMVACHWNDVPDDNRVENLRWATTSDNRRDLIRNGHDPNLTKTHCLRGHEFDSANTRRYRGRRHCRQCQRIHDLAHRAKRSAALYETEVAS
jgi:hypothetical protein